MAELTQDFPDDPLDRDDEEDDESEDSEEDVNEREMPKPVKKRIQNFNLTTELRADISTMVRALQQEGKIKAQRKTIC